MRLFRKLSLSGILLCALAGSSLAQVQCGRADWAHIPYDYYPGHRPGDVKAAAIIRSSEVAGRMDLVVYKADKQKRAFYYTPEYFETRNNGKSWQTLIEDQPHHLLAVPFVYFQTPSDSRILYQLMPDLGVYLRSEDGGQTWALPRYEIEEKSADQFAQKIGGGRGFHLEIRIVGVHPLDPKTLYAGIRVTPWPDSGDELKDHKLEGVYRSIDGGDHWTMFTSEIHSFSLNWTQTSALGISPAKPDILFGAGRHGIEKSEDGGKTWNPVGQADLLDSRPVYRGEAISKRTMLGAPSSIEVYEFLFDSRAGKTFYMLTNRGIFKTIDLGESWRLLDLGFDEIDAITTVGINPIHTNQIIVGSRYGLYLSEDGGCHFQRIPSPGERIEKQERTGGN